MPARQKRNIMFSSMPMRLAATWRALVPLSIRDRLAIARRRVRAWSGSTYYAAHGEDAVAVSWFSYFGFDFSKVRYVDVGAAHPTRLSNTYMLYRLGARGVLVEPDPEQARVLRQARPRDIVINAGVAFDDRRKATLFRTTSRVFNSFSRAHAESAVAQSQDWPADQRQRMLAPVEVPLIPLNEIVREHLRESPPHFISIDTEGADFAILQSIDFGLLSQDPEAPRLICIEASSDYPVVHSVLGPHGFELTARTPTNWLFVHPGRLRAKMDFAR
jgi:FkbM family methyltransferase